jgi:hypothetical protein
MSRSSIVTAIAAAGVVAMTAALAAAPAQAAQKRAAHPSPRAFDGLWSVLIETRYGPCDATYRYPVRIADGRVTQVDNDFSYQLSGAVAASGAIAVTVFRGGQYATGYGRLHGSSGAGRWATSGNSCYGTWSTMRRAAAAE